MSAILNVLRGTKIDIRDKKRYQGDISFLCPPVINLIKAQVCDKKILKYPILRVISILIIHVMEKYFDSDWLRRVYLSKYRVVKKKCSAKKETLGKLQKKTLSFKF